MKTYTLDEVKQDVSKVLYDVERENDVCRVDLDGKTSVYVLCADEWNIMCEALQIVMQHPEMVLGAASSKTEPMN